MRVIIVLRIVTISLWGFLEWETDFLPLLVLTRQGCSTGKSPVLVIIFLENAREFPEIITSTGAKFWLRFCLSVLALVIFKFPIEVELRLGRGMWGYRVPFSHLSVKSGGGSGKA